MAYYTRILVEHWVQKPDHSKTDLNDLDYIVYVPIREKVKELVQRGEIVLGTTVIEETQNYRIHTTKFATQEGAQEWLDFSLSLPGSISGEVIEI